MDRERDAFISYSHKRDIELAEGLQRGLHRLARPWTRRQVISVFRDTTSLAANSNLSGSIQKELARSRYFIYLASPEAAASRWVREEIAFWLANGPIDHFLIAVSGGTVAWDVAAGDFDWEATDALPDLLRGRFDTEPLWVDLSGFQSPEQLSLRHPEFRDAVGTLAARLHGIDKDRLDGEDVRQHRIARRMRRAAVTALSALLVTALVAGAVAWQQRGEALDRARSSASQALAARSLELAGTDPRRAAQLALYAEAVQPTSESAQALARAMAANEGVSRHFEAGDDEVSDYRGAGTIPAAKVALSSDGSTFAYYVDYGEVHLYDIRSGKSLASLPTQGPQNGGALEFSADGSLLVVETAFNELQLWSVPQAQLLRTIVASDGRELSQAVKRIHRLALSADGKWLAATYHELGEDTEQEEEHLGVWDTATGAAISQGPVSSEGLRLAFDSSGLLVTVGLAPGSATIRNYNPSSRAWSTSRELRGLPTTDEAWGVVLSPRGDRAHFLSPEEGAKDQLWDLTTGERIAELAEGRLLAARSNGVRAVEITADGPHMLAMSDGQAVTLYDFSLSRRRTLGSFTWPVLSLATSADGKWVAAAAENGAVSLFAATSGQGGANLPNEDRIKPADLASSGRTALRSAANGTELWTIGDSPSGIRRRGHIATNVAKSEPDVAVSPDGTRAALIQQAELTLWDTQTGAQVGSAKTYTGDGPRGPLLFMPDGIHLVVAENDRLLLLDSRTWETRQDLGEYKYDISSADSGDGRNLAIHDGAGEVTAWRWTDDARLQKTGKHSFPVNRALSFVLSRDGGKVAAIDGDHRISILDVRTGRVTRSSAGVQYGDPAIAFSKDSRVLVQPVRIGGEAGLQFWDTTSGDALGDWKVPSWGAGTSRTPDVQLLTGDGGTLLALQENGTLTSHVIDIASWRAALCTLVPAPLPQDVHDRYLKDLEVAAPCRT